LELLRFVSRILVGRRRVGIAMAFRDRLATGVRLAPCRIADPAASVPSAEFLRWHNEQAFLV
jgi:hypothetical protein